MMIDPHTHSKPGPEIAPGNGPLYRQVKALFIGRMVDGQWPPGTRLPSEMELARDIDVSQGTVRKALDEMCQDNLVIRHQGRGTFVATHTAQRELYHFFHIIDAKGVRQLPAHSQLISVTRRRADKAETRNLDLTAGAHVVVIERIRHLGARPVISETIALPAARFPGLDQNADIPNEVYGFYEQHYGVTIHKAVERLRAVAATGDEAKALGLHAGAPLLEIDRLAKTLDDETVEWRVSRCDSRDHAYVAEHT